jgi:hypothetical protein
MICLILALSLQSSALKLVGKAEDKDINEMSGIAKSRRYKDTYWVQNDSGDSARIFAIHHDGTRHRQPDNGYQIEGAKNVDWEDIAIDGNNIYISDLGNNLNIRQDLMVYVVKEPNPAVKSSLKICKQYAIKWPDQTEFPPKGTWNFDCESLAVHKGKMYFVTKWRSGNHRTPADGAAIYILEKPREGGVNVPQKLDVSTTLGGWVTAADISPDGKTLAVLVQFPKQSVWFFDLTKGPKILSHPSGRVVFEGANQCEAVCWDDAKTLLVTNEQREIFEIKR